MTSKFSYALTDLGDEVVRLGSISGLTSYAKKGSVATSSIEFDNPDGSLLIEPFRSFVMEELDCSATVCFKGYISTRDYIRAASMVTGAANRITASLFDLNAILSMKLITHSTFHYSRPAETDVDRLHWLLVQVLDTITVYDNGLIDETNPVQLTKTDYSGQFPQQVMEDCANRSGKNFYLYNDPTSGQISLAYFKTDDANTFNPSTLSISNDLSDISSTCFLPTKDATLARDPDGVYDGVYMRYTGGVVYVRVPGRFLARDVVGPDANTSDRSRAIELAQRMLDNHDSESATVTCTINIPKSQVNLLMQGMGVNAKFTHLPGWEAGKDTFVIERTIKQDLATKEFYPVEVVLGGVMLVNFVGGASDPDNEHSPLPPFVPSSGGTFTFVQAASTPDDTTPIPPSATFGATPTEGNLIVAIVLMDSVSGIPDLSVLELIFSDPGWILDIGPVGAPASDNRLQAMWIAHKVAGASEPTTVDPAIHNTSTLSDNHGFIAIAEYIGGSDVAAVDLGTLSGPSNTATLPSFTPAAGSSNLIVQGVGHEPNYFSTYSTGWSNRTEFVVGGSRQALALVDQIIDTASGSYTGTGTVAGIGESYWFIPAIMFSSSGAEPATGQTVAPESAISDGSRVIYQTNYPYMPGSLVVKVNGVTVADVEETDPETGMFTLPAAPAAGAIITWTYNVADPAPTGANNPPPPSSPPGIPPDPGTVPGGDGIYRQPQQEYVPAEVPDGIITVFTIVPYIAGNTLVYINGLIQRKGIDWNELSPAAGTIEFTTAPWTGASITVTAMPVTAAPTGSGFGNPSLYGPGINADTKANLQNNATVVSHRFRSIGGVLDTVRWQQRGGAVYSAGTGGTYNVTVQADVGGVPSGSALATQAYTPGNPGGDWTHYDEVTFSSPATLTAGSLYHIVFTNTHGTPASNYVSVNELFLYGSSPLPAGSPRQPLFADTDWAVLYGGVVQSRYTADMDLGYSGGAHQGMGYIQLMTAQYGTISGSTDMVRETFTVSGGDRTVTTASVRVRRSSGGAPLTVRLETGAGTLIEAVDVPASLVPISAAGSDNGGSVWVGVRFLAPHVLTSGQSYNLRLSCASGTTYTAAPIRKGTTEGMDPDTVFMDGAGQFTTNSGGTWTDLYTFDTDPPDLQVYFGVTT